MPGDIDKSPDFRDGMPFLGGALWLDLANSSFILDGNAFDFLADDASFARWVSQAGIQLEAASLGAERLAALQLRDLARDILAKLAKREKPAPGQIDRINQLLSLRTIHEQLTLTDNSLELQFPDRVEGPKVASLIASNLAHFLGSYEPSRLKSCDSSPCTMVFYDRGKNSRRRWCTMDICGNRDKVANYRARKAGLKSP